MESLKPFLGHQENLQSKAKNLTATGLALTNLLAEEVGLLNRHDEAVRLKVLHSSVRQQLDEVRSMECSAKYGYNQGNLIVSLSGLAIDGMIKTASKNKQLSAFADYMLKSSNNENHPFGLVLICIGAKGLPDDVGIVSISKLARESNHQESEVINELQEHDCLLFGETAFSLLIDRLVDDVKTGRLRLPISKEKLFEITAPKKLKLKFKKAE